MSLSRPQNFSRIGKRTECREALLQCAFQRANAALLQLHEKTAHRLFPIDHCFKAFLAHILPRVRTRDVLSARLQCMQLPGLAAMIEEKQPQVLQSLFPQRPPGGTLTVDGLLASLDQLCLLRDLNIEMDVWNPIVDYGSVQGDYFEI